MMRIFVILLSLLITTASVYAEEDMVSLVEQQKLELEKKEEAVKTEMKRLQALKREVELDIERYTKLLREIEQSLEQAETASGKRLRHIAKAYEAMQPADAAARLSGLDTATAVQILLKMKSKKAGLVIGNMDAKRATTLTKEIARLKK